MTANASETSFSADETEALKGIVRDWLNEEIVAPPFSPAIVAILSKLGLERSEVSAPPGTPQKLETDRHLRGAKAK